jgi:hypothetical protein
MPTLKPDDLIGKLLTASLKDVGNLNSCAHKDIQRDVAYATRRLQNEGTSFVTKTLPSLGKALDVALQEGVFSPMTAFKKQPKGTLPSFMKGLFRGVFDATGVLLVDPDREAVRSLRQICFMFYKLDVPYKTEVIDETVRNFEQVDDGLNEAEEILPEKAGVVFHAQNIIGKLFRGFDPAEITPRPGPGQCSTRVPEEYRYEPQTKYLRIHARYPYRTYYYASGKHLFDRLRDYESLPKADHAVSRLSLVPKDSRGPRIICMEPPEYMWFQQGLRKELYRHVENHWLTKGRVNFTDQSINGNLALEASRSQKYATLDMKEASDRISTALVDVLFDDVPELRDSLLALSTEFIELPDGRLLRKKKFAPMGSALCFPVMSIVHFALGVAAIHVATRAPYKAIADEFYVYGDDLVVPVKYVDILFDTFPEYGLKFNRTKSCFKGYFRESCGIDAFMGTNVTPTKLKKLSFSRFDGASLQTAFATFHSLFNRGMWGAAKIVQQHIEGIAGKFPAVSKTSAALGWIVPRDTLMLANQGTFKWSPRYQCESVNARIVIPRQFASLSGGWEQCLRSQVHVTRDDTSQIVRRGQLKIYWSRIPISSL